METAMQDANELAFKGLIRTVKQLVFSRDEITNEDVFQLGILSGEKTGTGYKPEAVLQFPHKSFQEHCAAHHVATRLRHNDRGPWEQLKKYIMRGTSEDVGSSQGHSKQWSRSLPDTVFKATEEKTAFCTAVKKLKHLCTAEYILDNLRLLSENGAFDDEPDIPSSWKALDDYHKQIVEFGADEKSSLFEFLMTETLCAISASDRAKIRKWVQELEEKDIKLFAVGVKFFFHLAETNPNIALQYLRDVISAMSHHGGTVPTPYSNPEFVELWESVNSLKLLITFLVEKLPSYQQAEISREIAEIIVTKSFDELNGGVLNFHLIETFMDDLIKERYTGEESDIHETSMSPVLLRLTPTSTDQELNLMLSKLYTHSALHVSRKRDDIVDIKVMTSHLKQVRNVFIAELKDLAPIVSHRVDLQCFTEALFQSPIASIELADVDGNLVSILLQNLPSSTKKLSMYRCHPPRCTLHDTVNLIYLYLEDCLLDVSSTFSGKFPRLKKLHVIHDSNWSRQQMGVIRDATVQSRMPVLEEIRIIDGNLEGCGDTLVDLMTRAANLRSVDFLGSGLSLDDGKCLLKSIQEGQVNHVLSLNLYDNTALGPLKNQLNEQCRKQGISLQIEPDHDATSPIGRALLNLSGAKSGQNPIDLGAELTTRLHPSHNAETRQDTTDLAGIVSSFFRDIDIQHVGETLGGILSTVVPVDHPASSVLHAVGSFVSTLFRPPPQTQRSDHDSGPQQGFDLGSSEPTPPISAGNQEAEAGLESSEPVPMLDNNTGPDDTKRSAKYCDIDLD